MNEKSAKAVEKWRLAKEIAIKKHKEEQEIIKRKEDEKVGKWLHILLAYDKDDSFRNKMLLRRNRTLLKWLRNGDKAN